MWIVNRTRGSCQRTFMSYSRLFSLSFRNKHKVKRKPSWDKSGNKHFTDPPRPSPARKKNQTPPGNHDIDFYPTSGRRCTQPFRHSFAKKTPPQTHPSIFPILHTLGVMHFAGHQKCRNEGPCRVVRTPPSQVRAVLGSFIISHCAHTNHIGCSVVATLTSVK